MTARRFELTRIPFVKRILVSRWLQWSLVALALPFFLLAILTGLFGTPAGSRNFGIVFVWIVWWALLILLLVPFAGRAWCAFMSRHKVYWAASEPGVVAFKLHVATPANEADEIYPTAVSDGHGAVLMVWQVGPMSTTGSATVKWATWSADGKPTGLGGALGTTTSGTKPTALVGKDGRFYIVTTAEK